MYRCEHERLDTECIHLVIQEVGLNGYHGAMNGACSRKDGAVKTLSNTVKILSALYALLMMVAALVAVSTQPLWSLVLTFAFALCLLASPRWDWLPTPWSPGTDCCRHSQWLQHVWYNY